MTHHESTPPDAAALRAQGLASVSAALDKLRFGTVTITVHEGRIVQIDVTEKLRLRPA